ncbi:MAG: hypothetical protein K0R12_617 [Gammaproteobacteria bacterium]|jgi:hypothetical protein|nr:hypothetical protein [Gammaproteobacteria bacterium]
MLKIAWYSFNSALRLELTVCVSHIAVFALFLGKNKHIGQSVEGIKAC